MLIPSTTQLLLDSGANAAILAPPKSCGLTTRSAPAYTSFPTAASDGGADGTGSGTPRMQAWLDSPVREAAVVFVNEKLAGTVWLPPYQVDATKYLHAGDNQLRIVVGNLAINEMAGRALPNYRLLNDRYGERFRAQDLTNVEPLPSGILGDLRLVPRTAP